MREGIEVEDLYKCVSCGSTDVASDLCEDEVGCGYVCNNCVDGSMVYQPNKEVVTKDATLIPNGPYCYTWEVVPSKENNYNGRTKTCPYWDLMVYPEGHEYAGEKYGYCHFMEASDSDLGIGLLFDQCKECGVNADFDQNDIEI